MRINLHWLVLAGLLVVAIVPMVGAVAPGSAKEPLAACPLTLPNGYSVPGIEAAGGYGNGTIWTNLYMWSNGPVVVPPEDDRAAADGSIHDLKWMFWRMSEGSLTVEGHRLDAVSDPLIVTIPDGYGNSGLQATSFTFPSAGCWEITAHLGTERLTFVTYVIPPPPAA